MRDFVKSVFSFSWALSLFGFQQTANVLAPKKAAKAFDSVTQATEGQMSDALKTTFDAGDRLQRSAMNLLLGFFSHDALNPSKLMRMTTDAAKESAEAVTQGVQGITATVRQAASAAMPPNPGMGTPPPAGPAAVENPQDWGSAPSQH